MSLIGRKVKMNKIAGQEKVDYTHCPNMIGAEQFFVMDSLVFFPLHRYNLQD
jgi:hypothetical protein